MNMKPTMSNSHFKLLFTVVLIIVFCQAAADAGSSGNIYYSGLSIGEEPSPVTDSEGHVYKTVKIGNQVFMAENLKTTKAPDGSVLEGVYAYDNDESHVSEYGRLYTWESAKRACMKGWHLPSEEEWNVLASALTPHPVEKLMSNENTGFFAKSGGRLAGGQYDYMGELGLYWTSTASSNSGHAVQILLIKNETKILSDHTPVTGGLSVRYVKD
jgi:uncharacterized protein (TIGR02145 family)